MLFVVLPLKIYLQRIPLPENKTSRHSDAITYFQELVPVEFLMANIHDLMTCLLFGMISRLHFSKVSKCELNDSVGFFRVI